MEAGEAGDGGELVRGKGQVAGGVFLDRRGPGLEDGGFGVGEAVGWEAGGEGFGCDGLGALEEDVGAAEMQGARGEEALLEDPCSLGWEVRG